MKTRPLLFYIVTTKAVDSLASVQSASILGWTHWTSHPMMTYSGCCQVIIPMIFDIDCTSHESSCLTRMWNWTICQVISFVELCGLTHWGRVTHICVSKQTIIGSDNGLSPSRRQAIIWTNAGILLIGTLGTNFSEIFIEIRIFSFKKMGLNVSSAKWRPFCLSLNVLTT